MSQKGALNGHDKIESEQLGASFTDGLPKPNIQNKRKVQHDEQSSDRAEKRQKAIEHDGRSTKPNQGTDDHVRPAPAFLPLPARLFVASGTWFCRTCGRPSETPFCDEHKMIKCRYGPNCPFGAERCHFSHRGCVAPARADLPDADPLPVAAKQMHSQPSSGLFCTTCVHLRFHGFRSESNSTYRIYSCGDCRRTHRVPHTVPSTLATNPLAKPLISIPPIAPPPWTMHANWTRLPYYGPQGAPLQWTYPLPVQHPPFIPPPPAHPASAYAVI